MSVLRIAVTGGIACGKSTVARMLEKAGCAVLDTDDVTHGLEGPGGAAVPLIAEAFGEGVIAPDGSVNRRKLGEVVFSNPACLARLNSILHPLVAKEVDRWLEDQTECIAKVVLVPLLYEAGFDQSVKWNAVLAVVCSEKEQIRRIIGRGFNEEEAFARIRAQIPCAEKAARADYAIWNDADIGALEDEVDKFLKKVLV